MALRLRRGTDAERQLITPAEGELIYTTDTKFIYVGDGITPGGILVTGEFTLENLDGIDLSTPPTLGQVLKWNGTQFVPSNDALGSNVESIFDLNDVFTFSPLNVGDVLIYDGFNFVSDKIRIILSDDSTVMLDTATSTFRGRFIGDGSGLTNLPTSGGSTIESIFDLNDVFQITPPDFGDVLTFDGFNFVPQKITRIEGTDSSVMLDASTNTFRGNFIGDGSQLTNLPGTGSILDLTDVYAFSPPDFGDVLTFDGFNFVPQKITRIEGTDSSVMLDASTNTFRGNFIGDGSQLINLPGTGSILDLTDVYAFSPPDFGDVLTFDGFNFVPQKITRIEGTDSSVMLDASTNTFRGNFIGDGSQLTNISLASNSIFDLNDVVLLPGSPDIFDVIQYDGTKFISQKISVILGNDSSVMLDANSNSFFGTLFGDMFGNVTGNVTGDVTGNITGNVRNSDGIVILNNGSNIIPATFTGNVNGNLTGNSAGIHTGPVIGDVVGSVFADDSSLLIDGVNRIISTRQINSINNELTIHNENDSSDTFLTVESGATHASTLSLLRIGTNDLSGDTFAHGRITFSRADSINGVVTTSSVTGRNDALFIFHDSSANIADPSRYVVLKNGNVGIGKVNPSATLDVSGPILPGVYADAIARDAAITAPVAGMMVFNTALQKFQGYVDDVGIAGGGAPTTTPGWIDLN